jgi:hypothetical protein
VAVTEIETTDGDTNCAILFTLAPVNPISIAVLPLGQVPFEEAKSAEVLLSTQALTIGTWEFWATAKPPTTDAPIKNPANTFKTELRIFYLSNFFYLYPFSFLQTLLNIK